VGGRQLGFPVQRLFNGVGGEHLDVDTIRNDDIVFAAAQESFIGAVTTFSKAATCYSHHVCR